MKLHNSTENWRDLLCDAIDAAEQQHGVDLDPTFYNEYAEELRRRVLSELPDYETAHQQSAGAFVIVQQATPEERVLFLEAVDKHLPDIAAAINESLEQIARGTETVQEGV